MLGEAIHRSEGDGGKKGVGLKEALEAVPVNGAAFVLGFKDGPVGGLVGSGLEPTALSSLSGKGGLTAITTTQESFPATARTGAAPRYGSVFLTRAIREPIKGLVRPVGPVGEGVAPPSCPSGVGQPKDKAIQGRAAVALSG